MKCKVCDTNTSSFWDEDLQKNYHICDNCEFIFADKAHIVDSKKEKSQYDNHNNSLEDSGYVNMFENFLDFFWQDITQEEKSALDFGSGPGPVLSELIKRRDFTCDIYDKFYQPKKVYENKKYSLITSTEVFEHLENPIEILHLLKSHLRKDGTIALMTLFHTNKKEDFLKWWYRRDPTHISFFRPKTFEVLAKKCGLKILKHDSKRVIIFSYM